jgi:spore coat polysaccharide biosynthesis protein SpsF
MTSKVYIIIQARTTSTRLPGKVILPLCGKTVLEVVVNRLKRYKKSIIIATTNDGTELPIVEICKRENIKYYQGSVNDVLERYYLSAKKFNAKNGDIIVRITSDCPLIDVDLLDSCIEMYSSQKYDYVSNRLNRTVPIGLDVEVFSYKILKFMHLNAKEGFEREHVTPYIYLTMKNKYKLGSCEESDNNSQYRLTLDERDDYKAIKEIYKKFDNQINFSYNELIELLKSNQYIVDINNSVDQNSIDAQYKF